MTAPAAHPEADPGRDGPWKIAHLATVDMSLALLLETELRVAVEQGHQVFAVSAPGNFRQRIEATGARFVPISSLTRKWSLRSDLAAVREVRRFLREERPDVLHTHTPKAGVLGRILGQLTAVPVVVNTVHGLWSPAPGQRFRRAKRWAADALEVFAAFFSDAELYQNAEDRRRLRWVVRDKGQVVGNGIDLHRFQFSEADRERVRAELSIGPEDLLVVGVGRQVPEKGIAELDAAALALRELARFVWVGPEEVHQHTPDGHGSVMTRLGMRDDMVGIYSASDVFVLPSWREGFSRASMEAAACRSAMVLSDIRGCREIGRDREELLLVPPRDVERLTRAIRELLTDPSLRSRLGMAAERRAHAEFDQVAVAMRSIATYRRLLTLQQGRPDGR